MSADSGARMPDPPRADFSLPKVTDIAIKATRFDPPKLRNFAPSLQPSSDAVEFIVKTDAPIPVRALGPALYVGATPVTEVTEIAENTYRFIAPMQKDLKQGDEIVLGWSGQKPDAGVRTAFRYRL